MISRERWPQRALAGIWLAALAVLSGVSCVGPELTLPCEGTLCPPGQYCSANACAYPTSCADLLTHTGPADDGAYVIQPEGRAAFTVYCKDMSTETPTEYLTLLHTHGNGAAASNFSAFNCNNCTDDAYQYFEKVRLDPATLSVIISDTTFATFVSNDMSCWATVGGACGTALTLGFAQAGNCVPAMPATGTTTATPGNVDLRGTPFSIDPSVDMVLQGWATYWNKEVFSVDRKVLNFSGGGNCGGAGPANGVFLLKQD